MRIGRYETKRVLGSGAHGTVFLAHDPKLGRDVAVKLLAQNAPDEIRTRFRREAQALAVLKHPNIVELYDWGDEDERALYVALEYVPGRTLFDFVREHGPMSEVAALCAGHDLTLALEHAHAHDIVHRDIKPENVLLHQGRIVLTDFGAVKAVARDAQRGSDNARTQAIGTPGFMAPEQFDGAGITPRTDIFAIGATLYSLVTDHVPYEGGSVDAIYRNLLNGAYDDPREHHSLLSADMAKLLARCLAPKPKDRYASAVELRQAIRTLLDRYGIGDVRDELVAYAESPARATIAQRERGVDAFLRDFKLAVKDKDATRAKGILKRLQLLAPLDDRAQQVSGVSRVLPSLRAPDPDAVIPLQRGKWMIAGFLLGLAAAGVAFTAVAYLSGWIKAPALTPVASHPEPHSGPRR